MCEQNNKTKQRTNKDYTIASTNALLDGPQLFLQLTMSLNKELSFCLHITDNKESVFTVPEIENSFNNAER